MKITDAMSINAEKCPSFQDFGHARIPLKGIKKPVQEIIGMEILVLDFRIRPSLFGKNKEELCLDLQFRLTDTPSDLPMPQTRVYVAHTNAKVLIEQITGFEHRCPFRATIVMRGEENGPDAKQFYSFKGDDD